MNMMIDSTSDTPYMAKVAPSSAKVHTDEPSLSSYLRTQDSFQDQAKSTSRMSWMRMKMPEPISAIHPANENKQDKRIDKTIRQKSTQSKFASTRSTPMTVNLFRTESEEGDVRNEEEDDHQNDQDGKLRQPPRVLQRAAKVSAVLRANHNERQQAVEGLAGEQFKFTHSITYSQRSTDTVHTHGTVAQLGRDLHGRDAWDVGHETFELVHQGLIGCRRGSGATHEACM